MTMIRCLVRILGALLLAFTLGWAAHAEELNLSRVDKNFYLLGMVDLPRLESSDNPALNQIFSAFIFRSKATAQAFVNIAKSMGVSDIQTKDGSDFFDGKVEENALPTYFVYSEQLHQRFKPWFDFTPAWSFKDTYHAVKAMSLEDRYGYPLHAYLADHKLDPKQLVASISRKAYIPLEKMNSSQARSYLLGLMASRATYISHAEATTAAARDPIRARYSLKFLRLLDAYRDQIAHTIRQSTLNSPSSQGRTLPYEGIEFGAYQLNINIPPADQSAVDPLITQRIESTETELSHTESNYIRNTYHLFSY